MYTTYVHESKVIYTKHRNREFLVELQLEISIGVSLLLQGLSRERDGLLIVAMDLNLCRQVVDKWGFRV